VEQPVAQLHAELQHARLCPPDETRHQSHQHLWMWVLAMTGAHDPSRAGSGR
jgi:hypothetical protein